MVRNPAGFGCHMRGIHFVQIPTSLTAQVTLSIGGKTGSEYSFAKYGRSSRMDCFGDPNVLETLGRERVDQ